MPAQPITYRDAVRNAVDVELPVTTGFIDAAFDADADRFVVKSDHSTYHVYPVLLWGRVDEETVDNVTYVANVTYVDDVYFVIVPARVELDPDTPIVDGDVRGTVHVTTTDGRLLTVAKPHRQVHDALDTLIFTCAAGREYAKMWGTERL